MEEPTFNEKWIVSYIMMVLASIVTSSGLIILFIIRGDGLFPKLYTFINIVVILYLIHYFLNRVNVLKSGIWQVALLGVGLFPLIWSISPIKIPQDYKGLRLLDDGYILHDTYCHKNCKSTQVLVHEENYSIGKNYYSWKWAHLLGRTPTDIQCCNFNGLMALKPYNFSSLFFGFFLILELTFEYLPSISLLYLIMYLFYKYRGTESVFMFNDFVSNKDFDHKKMLNVGLVFLLVLITYNVFYIQSL